MPKIEGGVKLKHGTVTRVAKRKKLSIGHVRLVAKGEREGSPELIREIRQEARRQTKKAA